MPSLEELRRWLRGEDPDAIPSQSHFEPTAPTDPEDFNTQVKRAPQGGKYKISSGGDDALLLFGKYNGHTIRELSEDPNGIGYLRWVLDQEFPSDLKDVIMFRLGMRKR